MLPSFLFLDKWCEKLRQILVGWEYKLQDTRKIKIDSFIHSLVFSLEGRAWQEPEPSHVTGMALAHCILGKFLRVVCHCFPPQNRYWYKIGSPTPDGSKNDVFILRSVSSIVITPARTGSNTSSSRAVTAIDHTNNGVRSGFIHLALTYLISGWLAEPLFVNLNRLFTAYDLNGENEVRFL